MTGYNTEVKISSKKTTKIKIKKNMANEDMSSRLAEVQIKLQLQYVHHTVTCPHILPTTYEHQHC
jgi:hypothetical protein